MIHCSVNLRAFVPPWLCSVEREMMLEERRTIHGNRHQPKDFVRLDVRKCPNAVMPQRLNAEASRHLRFTIYHLPTSITNTGGATK